MVVVCNQQLAFFSRCVVCRVASEITQCCAVPWLCHVLPLLPVWQSYHIAETCACVQGTSAARVDKVMVSRPGMAPARLHRLMAQNSSSCLLVGCQVQQQFFSYIPLKSWHRQLQGCSKWANTPERARLQEAGALQPKATKVLLIKGTAAAQVAKGLHADSQLVRQLGQLHEAPAMVQQPPQALVSAQALCGVTQRLFLIQ
jgi:hypothetical protein